jgi:hypothetical protein
MALNTTWEELETGALFTLKSGVNGNWDIKYSTERVEHKML